MESTLQDIIVELTDANSKFKAQVESQLGKIETTDFADEYKELSDVLQKLIDFSSIKEEPIEPVEPVAS